MTASSFLTHSDEVKQELLRLLESKEEILPWDFRAYCVSSVWEGCEWGTARLIEYSCSVFYQGDVGGDDCGVLVAEHNIYKVSKNYDVFQSLDVVSGDNASVGEAMKRVMGDGEDGMDDELFDDDVFVCGGTPYVLSDFSVKPEYRGKGLGYITLHLGLQAAGVEGSALFIYPADASEAVSRDGSGDKQTYYSDWEFLKKFYLGMDNDMKLLEEYNTIYTYNYNYRDSVKRNRENK